MANPDRHGKGWRSRWINVYGKRCSRTFAEKEDATRFLKAIKAQVKAERLGIIAPSQPNKTFAALCEYWEEHRAPQKRSGDDDLSMIRAHLRPFFGQMSLGAIKGEHIAAYKKAKIILNNKTVNNHLALLRAMLNEARDELEWVRRVPKVRLHSLQSQEGSYSYLRDVEEVRRFLNAAKEEDEIVYVMYSTVTFTGIRAGESAGLIWPDVDFERRLIKVGRSFDGPTKNYQTRYVPILDPLLPILRAWRLRNPLPVLFPNARGKMFGPSSRIFQEVLHRVLDRAGFPFEIRNGRRRRYIVFHEYADLFVVPTSLGKAAHVGLIAAKRSA